MSTATPSALPGSASNLLKQAMNTNAAVNQVQPQAPAAPSFLRKAGPLVIARLITAGLTLSIPLVLARVMALEEYGTYKQLFLIAQTLYYLLPFGMVQGLYFFIPRAEQKRAYYVSVLTFLWIGGALAAAALWGFGEPVANYFHNPALLEHRWSLAAYIFCLTGACPLEAGLTSQGKTKASACVYLVSDTVRALAMVVPILLGWGLTGMMHAVVGFTVLRLIGAWVVLMKMSDGPFFSRQAFVSQLAYAAPFGAAMLLAIPQQYAHQYAVSGIVAPAMFALYAVGCFQLPVVDLLYTPTSEVLMVQLGELDKTGRNHEAVHSFREAASKLSLAFFPMAAFLFAAAPEFIGALFGAKFLPAVPLFRVSVVGVVLAILPMDGVLRAKNETRHIFISYLVKALVTAPLVYFGVKHLGMMGGILSWAIAEAVGKATLLLRVPRALSTPERKLKIVDIIPWNAIGKASLSAAAAAVSVFVLRALASHAYSGLPNSFAWRTVPLMVAGVLFTMGYLTALWFAGVRPTALLANLRRRRVA